MTCILGESGRPCPECERLRAVLQDARTLLHAADALPRPSNISIDFDTTIRAIDVVLKQMTSQEPTP